MRDLSHRDPAVTDSGESGPTVRVALTATAACRITHAASGASLPVAVTPAFGGPGGTFSSTDLVAAALGSCIATSLAPVAGRAGIAPQAITIEVTKELATAPRRIAALHVSVVVASPLDPTLQRKLERAAATCAVHRSLHPELRVSVRIEGRRPGG